MASLPRSALRRVSRSISFHVANELDARNDTPRRELFERLGALESRLGEIERRLDSIAEQLGRLSPIESELGAVSSGLGELRRLSESQVQRGGESTELFGRLLRSATSRVDELEERLADRT